jgi:acetolactate synthase regulatory subunit
VHELCFSTPDPLDHCPRLLDVVRRMGFGLISVCATPACADSYDVRVSFMQVGDLTAELLANRVSSFYGVTGLKLEAR